MTDIARTGIGDYLIQSDGKTMNVGAFSQLVTALMETFQASPPPRTIVEHVVHELYARGAFDATMPEMPLAKFVEAVGEVCLPLSIANDASGTGSLKLGQRAAQRILEKIEAAGGRVVMGQE